MPTNANDLAELIDKYGIPAILLIIGILFAVTQLWPWYKARREKQDIAEVERVKECDAADKERNHAWIAALESNTRVNERVQAAMTTVSDKIEAQPTARLTEAIAIMAERTEQNQTQLMQGNAAILLRMEQIANDQRTRFDRLDAAAK